LMPLWMIFLQVSLVKNGASVKPAAQQSQT
jgi:hypothetical protein